MAICYNKLWKILIDKHMSKTQLIKEAKISTNAMARLGFTGAEIVEFYFPGTQVGDYQ